MMSFIMSAHLKLSMFKKTQLKTIKKVEMLFLILYLPVDSFEADISSKNGVRNGEENRSQTVMCGAAVAQKVEQLIGRQS